MINKSEVLIIGDDPVDLAAMGAQLQAMAATLSAMKAGVQAYIAKTAAPAPAPAAPAPAPAAPAPAPVVTAPAPTVAAPAPTAAEITRFNQRLDEEISKLFKGVYGTEWAREKVIGILQTEFPRIDPNEIAQKVYTKAPDRWEYTVGLVKEPEKTPEELVLPLPTWKEIPPTEVTVPETKSWTEFFKVIPDALTNIWNDIKDALNRIKELIKQLLQPEGTLYKIFDRLREFLGIVWGNFLEFLKDPIGKIREATSDLAAKVKNLLLNAADFLSKIGEVVWDHIKNAFNQVNQYIRELFLGIYDWLRKYIWEPLTKGFSDLSDKVVKVWDNTKEWIKTTWDNFKLGIESLKDDLFKWADQVADKITGFFDKLWEKIKDSIGGFFGLVWEWIKKEFRGIMDWFRTQWEYLKEGAKWVWEDLISKYLPVAWEKIKDAFGLLIPSAPEQGDLLLARGASLLAVAAGTLAAMIALGGVAEKLSGMKMGEAAAIVADFAGFKYITGALMGGLVTAAYAQPLKYWYNAVFRPYLPDFRIWQEALVQHEINDDLFKFSMKYYGIPDKYFDLYKETLKRPPSAFMLRYIAETEIVAPNEMFGMCLESRYSVEDAIYMVYAMSRGAMKSYISAIDKILTKCRKEGYIDDEAFERGFEEARRYNEVRVSYQTILGNIVEGTVKIPLDQKTLTKMATAWEAFSDSCDDKVSTLKSQFGKEDITEEEFRAELSKIVVVPEKVEDIINREKAKKKGKEEPDKGKEIRKLLISKLRDCYKEGFITKETFDNERKRAKEISDPDVLEDMFVEWLAFYDDRADQLKYFKDKAIGKEITIDEFRAKMVEWGMRPYKINLIIDDVVEKILVADRKQRAKLDSEIKTLRNKLRDYQDQLTTLESQISAETDERRLRTLITKYNSVLTKGSKVEEDLAAKEEELKSLTA
jgi:hypothetical protein